MGEWEQMTCQENRHSSLKSASFILLLIYSEKHVSYIFLSQDWKKFFLYFSFSMFASLKICSRLSSMLCSGNVCMMFNCRLYFIHTSEQSGSELLRVGGSRSPLLTPNSSTLYHAYHLVGNNFFFCTVKKDEWMSSLNFLCRVFSPVFIAFWFWCFLFTDIFRGSLTCFNFCFL